MTAGPDGELHTYRSGASQHGVIPRAARTGARPLAGRTPGSADTLSRDWRWHVDCLPDTDTCTWLAVEQSETARFSVRAGQMGTLGAQFSNPAHRYPRHVAHTENLAYVLPFATVSQQSWRRDGAWERQRAYTMAATISAGTHLELATAAAPPQGAALHTTLVTWLSQINLHLAFQLHTAAGCGSPGRTHVWWGPAPPA